MDIESQSSKKLQRMEYKIYLGMSLVCSCHDLYIYMLCTIIPDSNDAVIRSNCLYPKRCASKPVQTVLNEVPDIKEMSHVLVGALILVHR